MDMFFNPRAIAVVGASETPGKAGRNVLQNLKNTMLEGGLEGGLHAVNPLRDRVMGIPSWRSISELTREKQVDLAVICLPPSKACQAVIECIENDVPGIIVESGQLGRTPEEDKQSTREIKEMLANHPGPAPRLLGPNSIGIVDLHSRVNTSLIPFNEIPPGEEKGVAIIGQTGLIASGYLQRVFHEKTFPVSKVCCLGNKLDVSEIDVLEYLAGDPRTGVIALYLEDAKNGRKLMEVSRQIVDDLGKDVVVLKSGRSEAGARMVASHTGAVAGNDRVFDAACRSAGMVRVHDFEQLWSQAQFFHRAGRVNGNRVGVISISGAGCSLSLDIAESLGLIVPDLRDRAKDLFNDIFPEWFDVSNPVDLWVAIENVGPIRAWNTAIDILLDEVGVNALILVNLAMPESEMDFQHLQMAHARHPAIPIVICILGGHSDMYTSWKQEKSVECNLPFTNNPRVALELIARAVSRDSTRAGQRAGTPASGKIGKLKTRRKV